MNTLRLLTTTALLLLAASLPSHAYAQTETDCEHAYTEVLKQQAASEKLLPPAAREITNDPRPILIISDTHFGQRTGVVTLLENLQKQIESLTHDPEKVRFLTSSELPGINLPGQKQRAAFLSEKKFEKLLEEMDPQAIHIVVEGPIGQQAKKYLIKHNIPFTTSYTTMFPEYMKERVSKLSVSAGDAAQTIVAQHLRRFHQDSEGVMIATPSMFKKLLREGYDPETLRLWSRGVDTELFQPSKADPNLYSGLKRPISVYAGRVVVEKNLEDFLEMKIPGTKVILGYGDATEALKKKYPSAVFLGAIDHEKLPKYLASSDVFVFPSVTDTFGQVQLEANASGIPVVAYRVPGPQDVVGSTDSGVLAPYKPGSQIDNVRALEEAWEQTRKTPKGKPRDWAQQFSWRSTAVQFLQNLKRFPSTVQKEFADQVGAEFLEAEHSLVEATPFFSHPTKLGGLFIPSLRFTGNLARRFTPGANQVFELPTLLVPAEKVPQMLLANSISDEAKRVLFVRMDGKDYVRFFIHPTELDRAKKLQSMAIPDPVKWIATPTSSSRSLVVKDMNGNEAPFFIKTSISERMGRYKRAIDEERAIRAVAITNEMEKIHSETNGKLPLSNKTWDFLPETFSALPDDPETGGFIFRERPKDFADDIIVPWYSLIANREGKPRWIDQLFADSGRENQKEFVWEDLVKPLAELHDILAQKNGLTTELHQQNVLVRIDRQTGKVKGLVIRDMDAHFVDHSLRVHRLGKEPIATTGNFLQNAYLFRYAQAQGNQLKSYREKLRMESIEWIMKYVLSKKDLGDLLGRADQFLVQQFNQTYPDFAAADIGTLDLSWNRLHESATTPEEKAAYETLQQRFTPDLRSRILNSLRDWKSKTSLKPAH